MNESRVGGDALDGSTSAGVLSVALHNAIAGTGNEPLPGMQESAAVFPIKMRTEVDEIELINEPAYVRQLCRQVALLIRGREMKSLGQRRIYHFGKWSQKVRDFDGYYKLMYGRAIFKDEFAREVIPSWGDSSKTKMIPIITETEPVTPSLTVVDDATKKFVGYADLGPEPARTEEGEALEVMEITPTPVDGVE
jgi:hypothetical protein